MATGYNQIQCGTFLQQIATLLDDNANGGYGFYWVQPESQLALWEALTVFGATTGYWRQRGTFSVSPPAAASLTTPPYYDMSALLSALRPRTWTLSTMLTEILYHLLENPNAGISGTGLSGQVSITNILQAIQRAQNRFLIDCHLPNSVHANFSSVSPPQGLVQFPQASVFVHRVSWQDAGGQWANLWRDDAWVFDHSDATWPVDAQPTPQAYSEAELAPLQLQMYPPPRNAGTLEAVTVDSALIDITNPNSTFAVPNEWTHAIKYAALSEIFTGGSQITDPVRAQYCEQRYQQAVTFARDARSIIRLTLNGNPLPIDSLAAIDAGQPYWRNQTGPPQMAGIMYDLAVINPGIPDQQYSIGVDLVTPAPLPQMTDYIQIGEENLQDIADYVVNYLLLKCGGNEFKQTMGNLDNFQRAIATRKGVDAAKIRYFQPLFEKWQSEEAMRPDIMVSAGAK